MGKQDLIKMIDKTALALYQLNLEYGIYLDDKLENRIDELQNLLDLESKHLKDNAVLLD